MTLEKHKGLAKFFRDNPDGLMSFLMMFSSGEPRDEDYEEPLFEVLEPEDDMTEQKCWEDAVQGVPVQRVDFKTTIEDVMGTKPHYLTSVLKHAKKLHG